MRDFELVDHNLRAALRFFGQATGAGEIRALEGAVAIYSGLDFGVFNIAMLSAPVAEAPRGSRPEPLEARIAECGRFYQPHAVRWSFWLCEDLLDAGSRRRARQAFAQCGMRVISQPPGMLARALRPPEHPLPQIECRAVDGDVTREAFGAITSTCFDIPHSVSRTVYQTERAWHGDYCGYVGFAGGAPVSIVALARSAGTLGVYSLATLPEYRRRGYGEALMRAAVAIECQRAGAAALVLQSTESGYQLYRRMGFRGVSKYTVYLTK
jgi:GNAT superfamily N-acetyltransferase